MDTILFKRRLLLLVAAFLISLGATGWYGYQWHQATHWTQARLQKTVRLNITTGHQKNAGNGNAHPQSNRTDSLPGRLRDRLIKRLNRKWRRTKLYFFASLPLCLFSGGLLFSRLWLRRAG